MTNLGQRLFPVLALAVAGTAPAAWPHGIRLTAPAAMGGSSSSACGVAGAGCGLELRIDDPGTVPFNQAFVVASPANGFTNLDEVHASFFIDPQNLNLPAVGDAAGVPLMWFLEHANDFSGAKLIVYLIHYFPSDEWLLAALHWDGTLPGFAWAPGVGVLAPAGDASYSENRVDMMWRAGDPGRLEIRLSRYLNHLPDGNGSTLILDVPLAGQALSRINYFLLGVLGELSLAPGMSGTVEFDEISFGRRGPRLGR